MRTHAKEQGRRTDNAGRMEERERKWNPAYEALNVGQKKRINI